MEVLKKFFRTLLPTVESFLLTGYLYDFVEKLEALYVEHYN